MNFVFINEKNRGRYLRIVSPLGSFFAGLGIHPNILTISGFVLSMVAGLVYGTGHFFWAAWVVVIAGTCDVLDGQLARQTGKHSKYGAYLDSTVDRFSEIFIFLGIAWYFAGGATLIIENNASIEDIKSPIAVLFTFLSFAGSLMVSYTKARAEGLGVDCNVGWFQRPERFVLLIIGSLLHPIPVVGPIIMKTTLIVLAILTNLTALQRVAYVKNQLAKEKDHE